MVHQTHSRSRRLALHKYDAAVVAIDGAAAEDEKAEDDDDRRKLNQWRDQMN